MKVRFNAHFHDYWWKKEFWIIDIVFGGLYYYWKPILTIIITIITTIIQRVHSDFSIGIEGKVHCSTDFTFKNRIHSFWYRRKITKNQNWKSTREKLRKSESDVWFSIAGRQVVVDLIKQLNRAKLWNLNIDNLNKNMIIFFVFMMWKSCIFINSCIHIKYCL